MQNLVEQVHSEWRSMLTQALTTMDNHYLATLQTDDQWLPGLGTMFAAFTMPLTATRYILLGESPYPRPQSANGYAFWDEAVHSLWSTTGFSKEVNRATSLRNLLKMLLYARGDLSVDFSQTAIAHIDKSRFLQTGEQLFHGFMKKGFLLLNASLVYSENKVVYHARHWRPFIHSILKQLAEFHPSVQLVLFGRIAEQVPQTNLPSGLLAEHPYNISFITNPEVVSFFKPLDLLAEEFST